jgi:hypothetical protein
MDNCSERLHRVPGHDLPLVIQGWVVIERVEYYYGYQTVPLWLMTEKIKYNKIKNMGELHECFRLQKIELIFLKNQHC